MDALSGGGIENGTTIPAQAIEYINKLFELEKNLEVLSAEGRREQRLIQEKPVLNAYWTWAEKVSVGIRLYRCRGCGKCRNICPH